MPILAGGRRESTKKGGRSHLLPPFDIMDVEI